MRWGGELRGAGEKEDDGFDFEQSVAEIGATDFGQLFDASVESPGATDRRSDGAKR
jgi:hypothetical protein